MSSNSATPGETDLITMLRSLTVSARPDVYTYVVLDEPVALGAGIDALITEHEGITAVVTVDAAQHHGWPVGYRAAWLQLDVHSSLEAVGLTAAFATALTARGISCNVLAGYHHDHLLVAEDDRTAAIECLTDLRSETA